MTVYPHPELDGEKEGQSLCERYRLHARLFNAVATYCQSVARLVYPHEHG